MCQLPGRACPHQGQEGLVQPRDLQLQSAELLVQTSRVSSVWTTHSGALRDGAGSQMRGGGCLWHCVDGEHKASLPEAGAVPPLTVARRDVCTWCHQNVLLLKAT